MVNVKLVVFHGWFYVCEVKLVKWSWVSIGLWNNVDECRFLEVCLVKLGQWSWVFEVSLAISSWWNYIGECRF